MEWFIKHFDEIVVGIIITVASAFIVWFIANVVWPKIKPKNKNHKDKILDAEYRQLLEDNLDKVCHEWAALGWPLPNGTLMMMLKKEIINFVKEWLKWNPDAIIKLNGRLDRVLASIGEQLIKSGEMLQLEQIREQLIAEINKSE